jgi:hypothetical protein
MTASTIATTSTNASATRKMKTLVRNCSRIFGRLSRNTRSLKKVLLSAGQPGELTTSTAARPKKSTVLATAIQTLRAPGSPPRRMRDRRLPDGGPGCSGSRPGTPRDDPAPGTPPATT